MNVFDASLDSTMCTGLVFLFQNVDILVTLQQHSRAICRVTNTQNSLVLQSVPGVAALPLWLDDRDRVVLHRVEIMVDVARDHDFHAM